MPRNLDFLATKWLLPSMDGAVDRARQGKELLEGCVGMELRHTAKELVTFGQR